MIRRTVIIAMIGLSVASCAKKPKVAVNPYRDGTTRTEPVFYNGKNYDLKIRYVSEAKLYSVNIIGAGGRKLGGTPGDKAIVEQVVRSAVGHFGCPAGKAGSLIPGTSAYMGSSWNMQVRCD